MLNRFLGGEGRADGALGWGAGGGREKVWDGMGGKRLPLVAHRAGQLAKRAVWPARGRCIGRQALSGDCALVLARLFLWASEWEQVSWTCWVNGYLSGNQLERLVCPDRKLYCQCNITYTGNVGLARRIKSQTEGREQRAVYCWKVRLLVLKESGFCFLGDTAAAARC